MKLSRPKATSLKWYRRLLIIKFFDRILSPKFSAKIVPIFLSDDSVRNTYWIRKKRKYCLWIETLIPKSPGRRGVSHTLANPTGSDFLNKLPINMAETSDGVAISSGRLTSSAFIFSLHIMKFQVTPPAIHHSFTTDRISPGA